MAGADKTKAWPARERAQALMISASRLGLAPRAMEGCPASLARRFNVRAATGAGLAGPGVDPVELLGRSGASIDVDVIAKGRPSMADCIVDDAMNGFAKGFKILLGKGAPGSRRRDLRLMANFAGIDVSDARDQSVVHQHRLDGLAAPIGLCELGRRNGGGWLNPKAKKMASLRHGGAWKKRHASKSAGIVVNDELLRAIACRKPNPNMVVFALGVACSKPNGPRHAQMNHQNASCGQGEENVSSQALGAFGGDACAKNALGVGGRELIPQGVLAGFRGRDGGSGNARHLSADIFNFWKLWHKFILFKRSKYGKKSKFQGCKLEHAQRR